MPSLSKHTRQQTNGAANRRERDSALGASYTACDSTDKGKQMFALLLMVAEPAPLVVQAETPNRASREVVGDWAVCIFRAAKRYALASAEPAETIAEASFAICRDLERELRVTWLAEKVAQGIPRRRAYAYLDEMIAGMRTTNRQNAIAGVLQERAAHRP